MVLVLGFIPEVAEAAPAPIFTVDLNYVWGSARGSSPAGQFGSWNTNSWSIDLDYKAAEPSRWGYHLNLLTGTQRAGTGSWQFLEGGTDTHWVSEVVYRLTPPGQMSWIGATAGWGGSNWSTGFQGGFSEAFWSKGPTLGVAFYTQLAPNIDFGGRVNYSPSNTTRLASGGIDSTSSGSAWRAMFNVTYEQGPWRAQIGYSYIRTEAGNVSACPSCRFDWSSVNAGVGYRW